MRLLLALSFLSLILGSKSPLDIIYEQHDASKFQQFADSSTNVILDIGMNNGMDTKHFLGDGYSVLSVDADPRWIDNGKQKFSEAISLNKLLLLNMGVANRVDTLTFYSSKQRTRSSFDKKKASKNGRVQINEDILTNVIPCEILITAIPKRVYFMKIDIEEYDFHCIKGISERLDSSVEKPLYVSWENHFRRSRPQFDSFPAFDMRLILSMARAGYTKIKMSFGVSGTYFGDDYPNEIVDCYTNSTNWRSISEFVRDGVDCGTRKPNAYFDFHMSL
jgi:FkbM family methyltransferase